MLDKLKPGMTQRQVIYVMGNPVLQNPYEAKIGIITTPSKVRDEVTKTIAFRCF